MYTHKYSATRRRGSAEPDVSKAVVRFRPKRVFTTTTTITHIVTITLYSITK